MSVPLTGPRNTYRRSGRVNWGRFLPYVLLTFLASATMALCLYKAFEGGFYYFFIAPVIASLPVAAVVYWSVGGAHCRNRTVAGIFGLLAAAVLYLGYFHVHFVEIYRPGMGPAAVYRVDLLPWFISLRMQRDVMVEEGGKEREPSTVMNWFLFGLDFLVVIAVLVAVAVTRSARVYCERCRRWSRRLVAHLPPGTAREVERALRPGCLDTLPEVEATQGLPKPPHSVLTIEYCRKAGTPDAACPAYLTAKEIVKADTGAAQILSQIEITPGELRALAGKIAALRPAAMSGRTAGAATGPAGPLAGELAAPAYPETPAYVETLPPEWGDEVLGTKNKVRAVLASLMPVIVAAAGLVMLAIGLWRQPWAAGAAGAAPVVGWLLIGLGVVAFGFGGVVCWKNVDYFNFRLSCRITRHAIQFRPTAVVSPDDPDAIYVEIVPREYWGTLVPDRTADAGFLRIDTRTRELLFEGARQRYRIPGEAVASCEVESINPAAGKLGIFVAVVRTRDPYASAPAEAGESVLSQWEAPFLPRPTTFGRYSGARRRELAEELRDRIRVIMPPGEQASG